MKAVVLEIRDGVAAVLREDGTVEKIRRECRVGDTVELPERGRIMTFPQKAARWAAGAAAALLLVSGGAYGYNNAYAYSYVTLDVNPSIEYVLNRRNLVLRVDALNEDGETLARALNDGGVRGEGLTDAIDETTRLLYEEAYLGGGESDIYIHVYSRGETQREALAEEVGAYFTAREDESLTVYVTNGDRGGRPENGAAREDATVIGGPRPAQNDAQPESIPAYEPAASGEPGAQEQGGPAEDGPDAMGGPERDEPEQGPQNVPDMSGGASGEPSN